MKKIKALAIIGAAGLLIVFCGCIKEKNIKSDNHIEKLKEIAGKDSWKPYSGNPVMAPGKEGQWDAGSLGSMSVIKVKNKGREYTMCIDMTCKTKDSWGKKTVVTKVTKK